MKDIYEIIEDMIDRSGKSRREIAEDTGKEYSTLRRELNPFDQNAKLGVEMLIPLMRSTGRIDALHFLAERMGYRLERINALPNKTTVPEELLDTYQSIAAYHQAIQGKAPLVEVGSVKQHRIMTHHRRPILTPSGRVCKHPARGLRDDRLSLTGRMSFASVSSSRFLSR